MVASLVAFCLFRRRSLAGIELHRMFEHQSATPVRELRGMLFPV